VGGASRGRDRPPAVARDAQARYLLT
jgi:hypothetical protein